MYQITEDEGNGGCNVNLITTIVIVLHIYGKFVMRKNGSGKYRVANDMCVDFRLRGGTEGSRSEESRGNGGEEGDSGREVVEEGRGWHMSMGKGWMLA